MSREVLTILKSRFPDAVLDTHSECGDDTAVISGEALLEVCRFLKEAPQTLFDQPVDLTCVDYAAHPEPRPFHTRFVVVYHLRSITHGHRIRLKIPVPEESPAVESVVSVWKGFVWFEREVFDMFGLRFNNHPDLRRILLYPEFTGHPLRKDFPQRGYQPTMDMPTLPTQPSKEE